MIASIKWILIIPIIVAFFIVGIVFRLNLKDSGIAGMKSQADIPAGVRLEYPWGENSGDEKGLTEVGIGRATGWNGIASAPVIAVVTPTGKLDATRESFGQEITIKKSSGGKTWYQWGRPVMFIRHLVFLTERVKFSSERPSISCRRAVNILCLWKNPR